MKKLLLIFMAGVVCGSVIAGVAALTYMPRFEFITMQMSDAHGTMTVLYRTDRLTGDTSRTFGASSWHPVREGGY